MTARIDDVRIRQINELISPESLIADIGLTSAASRTVANARGAIHSILNREDDRLLVIAGPCSIHDPAAALDYAGRLQKTAAELSEDLCVVMRVYFEKPRTTVGWKGLINDPDRSITVLISTKVCIWPDSFCWTSQRWACLLEQSIWI